LATQKGGAKNVGISFPEDEAPRSSRDGASIFEKQESSFGAEGRGVTLGKLKEKFYLAAASRAGRVGRMPKGGDEGIILRAPR